MSVQHKNKLLRIIALTPSGRALAERLQQKIINGAVTGVKINVTSEVVYKPKPFIETVQAMFNNGHGLIFICSSGIVFRTLAPVLKDKYQDPPVIVLDEAGQYVVPLLSGHEGGANELASQVANALKAQLVLTTAKQYLKPIYTVGMGCERHCSEEKLQSLLSDCLAQAGLNLDQIDSINSIDIKADEVGLIELAQTCKKPYQTYNKQELSAVEHLLSVKSDYVYKVVGVYGVAEAAALVAAQATSELSSEGRTATASEPELVLNKQKNAAATCAIARSYRNEST